MSRTHQDAPAGEGARSEESAIGAASFVLALRAHGIRDTGVLRAMELVPRELFAPRRFADLARKDVALPLACGQTMTAPKTVAVMLVALGAEAGQTVLEIGTGSGYVTALLAQLGCEVVSVERFGALAEGAVGHLAAAGLKRGIKIEHGDGLAVRPRQRFDRILLNGSAPSVPATLTSLLGPGGRLVGAATADGPPRLLRIERVADGESSEEHGAPLRISPLLDGVAQSL
ncbi:MAG TPA: protein-L-isoaspartate O-methyltransferase [Microvirga sp.]|nr:protein-L-isoaspartate O-methyltransferase [Microvirga sp.]